MQIRIIKKIFKQFYEVSGLEVWKQVVTYQPKNIKQTLKIAKLKLTDIDFFIFHQANKKLIDFLLSRLQFHQVKLILQLINMETLLTRLLALP